MPDLVDLDLGGHARRLRLDTLLRLRWLAIAGQSTAVIVIYGALGFQVPVGLAFLAIAASAWLNIALRLRFPTTQRLKDGSALAMLAFDILQLSGLLFLTGGLSNPFALLFLAPVMVSAMSLSWKSTLVLFLIVVGAASFLVFHHFPLPWFRGVSFELPILYVGGIWMALVSGAAFIAVYAHRVSEEARTLSDALAATELVLAREQHLTQLDGLAAAAAHELGTPLATITLVVKELEKMVEAGTPVAEDVALIAQEVGRCRTILSKIASLGNEGPGMLDEMSVHHLVEEVVGPQRDFGVAMRIDRESEGEEPICLRNPGLLYGLGNIVENAIDFARSEVRILIRWDGAHVSITIEDDGPGFSPDVLTRLGEPYITSKGQRRAKIEDGSGLGLGLFIAKTLLERSGATVVMSNIQAPASGARVEVIWTRVVFERRARAYVDAEL
jgi:two-component system sensor histidine kinase RegB